VLPPSGRDFGSDVHASRAGGSRCAAAGPDLSQDAAPAASPGRRCRRIWTSNRTRTAAAADASVSPASVAAENSNLMDFDLAA
jgi:pilus assembly protein FimV